MSGLAAVQLQTPSSGGGPRPTLVWSGVPGADVYFVTLFTPSGTAYWAWQGSATSVELGDGSGPLPANAPGPKVADGMSWQVLAYASDGSLLAASERTPIST